MNIVFHWNFEKSRTLNKLGIIVGKSEKNTLKIPRIKDFDTKKYPAKPNLSQILAKMTVFEQKFPRIFILTPEKDQ